MFNDYINSAIAVLLLRTVTGILFFFQGYDKLYNVKIENVVRAFNDPTCKFRLPVGFLRPAVTLSSVIEMICGFLLILGAFKSITLYLLSFNMIFVAFIFSSMKPMWEMNHFFPRMIFIILLLFIPLTADIFSIDYLLGLWLR